LAGDRNNDSGRPRWGKENGGIHGLDGRKIRFWPSYFPLRLAPPARFFAPDFVAALALFFGDFRAGLAAKFVAAARRVPPPKMLSQLSEYCFVAPTRTMLIVV
jgi:hypothetical protein